MKTTNKTSFNRFLLETTFTLGKSSWSFDKMTVRSLTLLVALSVVCVCGCGAEQGDALVGFVDFEGRPVFPGSVIFVAADGSETLSANLNDQGQFTVRNVKKSKYRVAVQTQSPGGPGGRSTGAVSTGTGQNREATVPDRFSEAFVDIPDKFRSAKTSGLEFDFSDGVLKRPLQIMLVD